jgi:hypothetical protein
VITGGVEVMQHGVPLLLARPVAGRVGVRITFWEGPSDEGHELLAAAVMADVLEAALVVGDAERLGWSEHEVLPGRLAAAERGPLLAGVQVECLASVVGHHPPLPQADLAQSGQRIAVSADLDGQGGQRAGLQAAHAQSEGAAVVGAGQLRQ